jgi:tetratricopeptide (TPR) repeat protein
VNAKTEDLQSLLADGDVETARQVAEARLAHDAADTDAWCALAKLDLLQLHLDAATEKLAKVSDRSALEVVLVRAGIAALEGDDAAALALFEEVLERSPGRAEALVGAGISLARLEDMPVALTRLTEAAKREPTSGLVHYHLGRCQLEMDQILPGLESLFRCIELDPLYPDAYVCLARASAVAGDAAAGKALLEQGLKLMPDQAQLLAELTNLSVVTADLDGGYAAAARLAKSAPRDAVAQNNVALHFLANGQLDEAIDLCTKMNDQGQMTAGLASTLALAYEAQGDAESAMTAWAEAVHLDHDDWRAPNNLGLLLLRSGQPTLVPRAIDLLHEANRRAPSQLEPLLNLALAWARAEEKEKAKDLAAFVASYGLHPEHPVRTQAERLVAALANAA